MIIAHILVLAGTGLLAQTTSPHDLQESDFPKYVGRSVCLECHVDGHASGVCTLEEIPTHDTTFAALTKPTAKHIAALSGLPGAPAENRICLGCHGTAADEGPRWTMETFDPTLGVQCEACHGAGSFHVENERLKEAGRPVVRPDQIRRSDRDASCKECHIPRPSHDIVLKQGYRRPATDRLYKTPVELTISSDGKQLYVVCQNSNSVAVVDTTARAVVKEIPVGARPHDATLSPDGRRLYVTNWMADTLTVIDTDSRCVVTEVPVGDEPHGVLTSADGKHIYVLNTSEDTISLLDAEQLTEIKRLTAGRGPWSLARSPDGKSIAITSVRPNPAVFRATHSSEVTIVDTGTGMVSARPNAPDANMLQGVAYVPDPPVALFTLMRTRDLVPATRLGQGWLITHGLGLAWPDGRVDQVLLDQPNDSFSDANDIAVSPDGRFALVTGGGVDEVAVVDVRRLLALVQNATEKERRDVLPDHLAKSELFVIKRLPVGMNPRGVIYAPDGRFAYVANALEDSVAVIDTSDFTVVGKVDLGGPEEVTETRFGERLFHSAANAYGRQFSCRSCHPDGHTNGLTIDIEADGIQMVPVDNRTLRGILDTGPFKWEGTNPSLMRQCGPRLAVFFTRIHPFTPEELQALVRYECMIERPPNRFRQPEGLTLVQRRGKAMFERTYDNDLRELLPEERCTTCHNTPYKTSRTVEEVGTTMWLDTEVEVWLYDLHDDEEYGVLGSYFFTDTGTHKVGFDSPHLNNIYDSAPYLHNGVAHTLEEIWTTYNMVDKHGFSRDMTRKQLNELVAYLKAL